MADEPTNLIVVGIDGSDQSNGALAWAINEAQAHGARLALVTAWHIPNVVYGAPGFAMAEFPNVESFEEAAQDIANQAAETAKAAGVDYETVVEEGQAADVLIERAKQANLLVVGSRGRGGFAGLLLGSVSAQCAHHAPCPVLIIHPPR